MPESYQELSNLKPHIFKHPKPRIFKYTFGRINRGILVTKIEGPPLRNILDIQEQNYALVLWAEVDTAWMSAQKDIKLYCAWTGDPPPGDNWTYFKTIQSKTDGLVYHLYLENEQ